MNRHLSIVWLGLLISLPACDREGFGNEPADYTSVPLELPPPSSPYFFKPCAALGDPAVVTAGIPALPGGLWNGTLTNELLGTTSPFQATVSEDGRFHFHSNYKSFVGSLQTGDVNISGNGIAYAGGVAWSDGSFQSEVEFDGVIIERDSIAANWRLASGDYGCFEASYAKDDYEKPSSLQLVEGNWSSPDSWDFLWTLSIEADGHMQWQDPYFCGKSGQLALIDERYNLYEIQYLVSDCDSVESAYSGLAYLSPAEDYIVLNISNGSTGYAISF